MFYRRKLYKVKPDIVESFNSHFNTTLLPTQQKYGTRLIGRWMIQYEEYTEIFAIWEYDSQEDYEEIETKVRSDQAHIERVAAWYEKHGGRKNVMENYVLEIKNEAIQSTVLVNE
ncbi:NIPSNAP family protein [Evansella sp. AB-rgal1]|uniref:NIPSNAP family protein n=1 Tax=Evansella sp. AB-rgal1 TaxID=3242696 RepID=UPI00359D28B2